MYFWLTVLFNTSSAKTGQFGNKILGKHFVTMAQLPSIGK